MPIGLPASRWMLEIGALALGTETELVLKSRWAAPQRLWENGFRWRWKDAGEAVANLAHRRGLKGFFEIEPRRGLTKRPWLPAASRR